MNNVVEEGEVVFAGTRFHTVPGKFSEADNIEACRDHSLDVFLPVLFRPVFRIIAAAEPEAFDVHWPPVREPGLSERFFVGEEWFHLEGMNRLLRAKLLFSKGFRRLAR